MPTVQECWDFYVKNHLVNTVNHQHTLKYWTHYGLSDFAQMDPDQMTQADYRKWINKQIRLGRGPATIRRRLISLSAALNMAERNGLIHRAPHLPQIAHPPPRMRALSREECKTLLDAADRSGNWRKQVFVRLALATGQRPGAICELTWQQVNMQDGIIDFRATGELATRKKHRAVVPINDMASVALAIARRNAKGDRVLHRWGRGIRSPNDMMKELRQETRIKGLSAHVLRHTVASLLLQDNQNLLQVSKLLGHSNSKITEQVYFQHPPQWLKDLTDNLKF